MLTFVVGLPAVCLFLLPGSPRQTIGIIGVVLTILMYAGPVRQMVLLQDISFDDRLVICVIVLNTIFILAVWTTNNVAHMSFWVAGAAFLSGLFRTIYACLIRDWLNLVSPP